MLGGRQKAPTSRLIAGELEASVKQRAEPEAEAIATIADLNPKQKNNNNKKVRKTLERKREEEQEPLDWSHLIRHERTIIKKKKYKNYLHH